MVNVFKSKRAFVNDTNYSICERTIVNVIIRSCT